MAERERLTNKERRAQAREERKRKEAEAAAKRKKNQLRNGLVTVVIVAVIAAVVLQAFLGGPDTVDAQILVRAGDAEEAELAAGCEMLVEREPLPDRSHFEGTPPPADTVYTGIRPTHSGPHAERTLGIETYNRQMDEVVSTHNLEHGAVIVWYGDDADGRAIRSWADTLNASGFAGQGGGGIITSPYTDPGLDDGVSVALRAWGTAMDCEEWDEDVANAFVARNFGSRGIGPERMLAPYPDHVLDIEGEDVGDTSEDEAPTGGSIPAEEMSEIDPDDLDDEDDEDDDADGED